MDIKKLADVPPWEWPEDAAETILQTLTNKQADDSDRLIAAELGGENVVVNDELAGALLAVVGSNEESDELRGAAAIALGPALEQAYVDEFEDGEDAGITERMFHRIESSLQKLYVDEKVPKEVRRRVLEASVRAPQGWHANAIKAAYASGDDDWVLTAVFSMAHVRGFDEQILEALENPNPPVRYEAVRAAGNWELDAAWDHITALLEDPKTSKPLQLAAIGAIASIRPNDAKQILIDLTDSDDEEIVEAAQEAMVMAATLSDVSEEEGEWENGKWTA
jgi:hypothetical protein